MATFKDTLAILITGDARQFVTEIERAGKKSEENLKRVDAAQSRTADTFIKTGAALVGVSALAGAGLYKMAQQASDLNESITKSEVVFGSQGDAVVEWAGGLADSFGLSKREALEAAGAFGSMFRTTGLAEGKAASMSERMTELAGDMASFNNEDPSDMLERLRSGLAGEAEPLRRFGVLLSEARVQSYAYANGIAETGTELTEAQKVQARYGLILKDTALQQGDFERTADGAANSQRRLAASWDNLTTSIGQSALPVLQKVVGTAAAAAGGIAGLDEVTGGAVGNVLLLGTAGTGAVGGLLLLAGSLSKLKSSLAETAAEMPRVATAAKGLGALAVLAGGILQVKSAVDELQAAGEKRAGKFEIVPGSKDFPAQIDAAQQRLNKLAETYDKMGSGMLGQKRSQAAGEIIQSWFGADVSKGVLARSAEIDKLSSRIDHANEVQLRWARNSAAVRSQLGQSFFGGGFIDEATLSTETLGRLADVMGVDLFAKGKKGREAVDVLTDALTRSGGPTEANAQALIALTAAQGGANLKTREGAQASEAQAASLEREKKALDARRLATLAAFDSEIGAQQANAALAETLKGQNNDLDRNAALLAAAGAQARAAGDNYKAMTGDTMTAAQEQQAFRDALIALGTQYPPLREQVNGYLARLDALPPEKNTDVNARVYGEADVDRVRAKVDAMRDKDVTITVRGREFNVPWSLIRRNNDGSPDLDGDPNNSREHGGPIPGPRGKPVPILAHGGEFMLSADVVDAIRTGSATRGLGRSGAAGGSVGQVVEVTNNYYTLNLSAIDARSMRSLVLEALQEHVRTSGSGTLRKLVGIRGPG